MSHFPANSGVPPQPDDQDGGPVYSEADWQSLVDYLSGEASPDAQAAVQQRLANDPAFAAFAAPLIQAWRAPVPKPEWDWDTNWDVIQRKAAALNAASSSSPTVPPTESNTDHSSILSRRRGIATWGRGFMVRPTRWRSAQWVTLAFAIIAAWTTKNVIRAHLWPSYYYQGGLTGATIRLPDGSLAILAPGSYLGTGHGFPNSTRTVYLFGDAHFIVAHNQRIPFVAQTLGVGTRVLGTTFHLHVDTMPQIRVDVTQGAVALETQDSIGHWRQVQVLTAGQAVQVPLLADWMAKAGYTVAAAGVPIMEAARIEEALRRAAIRIGAAAAARRERGSSTGQ